MPIVCHFVVVVSEQVLQDSVTIEQPLRVHLKYAIFHTIVCRHLSPAAGLANDANTTRGSTGQPTRFVFSAAPRFLHFTPRRFIRPVWQKSIDKLTVLKATHSSPLDMGASKKSQQDSQLTSLVLHILSLHHCTASGWILAKFKCKIWTLNIGVSTRYFEPQKSYSTSRTPGESYFHGDLRRHMDKKHVTFVVYTRLCA